MVAQNQSQRYGFPMENENSKLKVLSVLQRTPPRYLPRVRKNGKNHVHGGEVPDITQIS